MVMEKEKKGPKGPEIFKNISVPYEHLHSK